MTEPEAPPPESSPPAEPPPTAVPAPPRVRRHDPLFWLCLLGFLILAAGIAYVWRYPEPLPPPPPPDLAPVTNRLAALDDSLKDVQARLALVQNKLAAPAPPAPDIVSILAPIESRLAALEHRPPPAGLPDAAALQSALAPLSSRIDALEATTKPLANRLDALEASLADLKARIAKIARSARLAAASAALAEGRPLGAIDAAPPALTRFATTAPPTLASLRLAFPAAAEAQLAAGPPVVNGTSFLARLRARLGSLFTLRQGEHVIVGNPAAGTLARAEAALDAGDLAATLAALAALPTPLAPAITAWEDQARALLAAQKALSALASED